MEVLVLGPPSGMPVILEACDWSPWTERARPCSSLEGIEEVGRLDDSHGFFVFDLPSPDSPVPEECTRPEEWRVWTGADEPIPDPVLCEVTAWYRLNVTPRGEPTVHAVNNVLGTRDFDPPLYPSLADVPPDLVFVEDDEGLSVTARVAFPDDVLRYSDSQLDFGLDGRTVYVGLESETGPLRAVPVREFQRPADGSASRTIEFDGIPEVPLRLAVNVGASRPFPGAQSTAWVFEADRTPSGEWTTRTLLPSGDLP